MNTLIRQLLLGTAVACGAAAAQAHVSVGVGINFGVPYGTVAPVLPYGAVSYGYGPGRYWVHGGVWYRPWGPRFVVVAPPLVYGAAPAPVVMEPPAVSVAATQPDPVITPRNGQSAQQTEYDRQQCNRWATTQPAAVADAGVFQRAVEACMDGRGYTTK